jgi:hypothetical protein
MLIGAASTGLAAKRRIAPRPAMTDAQVRDRIIRTSMAIYDGVCPCPHSLTAKGRRCGRRSKWKAGGDGPTCYPNEVSKAELREWRARHGAWTGAQAARD